MNQENCCVVTCDMPLDQTYWDNQYQSETTGWDLGDVSPPIKSYVDAIKNKEIAILIPGCGNSYEAAYLLEQGFTNITVIDIASTLVHHLKLKFENNKNIKIILGDFFEHQGVYDLIIEQTFFCALPPSLRQKYVWKMAQLLSKKGKLSGLLFNREFEVSPPFGGNQTEYEHLFKNAFIYNNLFVPNNSVEKRQGHELFMEFSKNETIVTLYQFEGITCNGCMTTVSNKFQEIDGVMNVSMSSDFSEILIVSATEVELPVLQHVISYDDKYKITKIS